MMWEALGTALALVLVIEGIMPFLNPSGFRRTLRLIIDMDDKTLRVIGLLSMAFGVLLLYLVN
ncbi:MAG: DUF2065 domain-containing protein [Pseudomonadota bacterium]|nr:DUF2065 domain-containing protein [Pseudomonadota bacterium]